MARKPNILETLERMRATLREDSGGLPMTKPTDEDPLHSDEDAALQEQIEISLREVLSQALSEHLAREYAGRPEDLTYDRVMEYMPQLGEITQRCFGDRDWLNDIAQSSMTKVRLSAGPAAVREDEPFTDSDDGAHPGSEDETDEDGLFGHEL